MLKVSVIVPVYNVEQYIGRCLDSLTNQTIQDIEIIVVNDCTPDKSMQIVEEYKQKNSKIRIINHEKNLGLMIARQTGYMASTADYITFCDSDDTLPPNSLEILLNAVIGTDADIVSGNLKYIDITGKEVVLSSFLNYGGDKESVFRSLLKGEMRHNLCSKLFKRSLLQDYKYETYKHFTNGEDGCLFYQVVENSVKTIQIDVPIYNYFQNIHSSSQLRLTEKGINSIIQLNKTRERICYKYTELHYVLFRCISKILNDLLLYYKNTNNTLHYKMTSKGLGKYISLKEMNKYYSKREMCKFLLRRTILTIYYNIQKK